MKTVVALFDNFSDAQRVVQELVDEGIDRDRISLVAGDAEGRYAADLDRTRTADRAADDSTEGAATGAVIGGIGGALIGIGALAIPGIGPVVAAGPLIAGLVGAGVGAAVGGLVGALIDAGVPEDQAGYYVEGVRRGSTLVAVEAAESATDRIVNIFSRYNPVNIEERAATWRDSSWTASATGGAQTWGTTGMRSNGGEWATSQGHSDLSIYDTDFRNHYQSHYAGSGYTYEQYEPAYRYGYTLATDDRYADRDWRDIEEDARLYWTNYHTDSPWEKFKDAVRHGWERVKQAVR